MSHCCVVWTCHLLCVSCHTRKMSVVSGRSLVLHRCSSLPCGRNCLVPNGTTVSSMICSAFRHCFGWCRTLCRQLLTMRHLPSGCTGSWKLTAERAKTTRSASLIFLNRWSVTLSFCLPSSAAF
uniref:Putative secreted protein n=1 Tax=Ixodes ricinus TaxID=34613 RepID=A0A6B0UPQ6_IXORI